MRLCSSAPLTQGWPASCTARPVRGARCFTSRFLARARQPAENPATGLLLNPAHVPQVQGAAEAGEPAPAPPPPPSPPSYQQYYQAYPPPYPPLPPPEPAQAAGGVPAFVWVGVGVLLAFVWGKVSSFLSIFRGGAGGGGGNAQEKMMGWVRPLAGQLRLASQRMAREHVHTCCSSGVLASCPMGPAAGSENTQESGLEKCAGLLALLLASCRCTLLYTHLPSPYVGSLQHFVGALAVC